MAEQKDEASDKPHDPTPKKRQDARKKGDVPRSPDVYTALAYAGIVIAAVALGPWLMIRLGSLGIALLQAPGFPRGAETGLPDAALWSAIFGLMPLLAVPIVFVLGAAAVQGHLIMVGSKLAPKLSRISIISNAGQKFGIRGMVEFVKSSAKLTVACVVLAYLGMQNADEILGSLTLEPAVATVLMLELARDFMIAILILTTVIAAADYFWQAADWTRRNRMSHKDLRDEHKEVEGDPDFKGRRRQRAQEIASKSLVDAVRSSDVVIVNPTHYAVALKWERGKDNAPVCAARGLDEIALAMRALAETNDVPIHSDPPTARMLYRTLKVGQEILPDHYKAVAAAIRFADELRAQKRRAERWTT